MVAKRFRWNINHEKKLRSVVRDPFRYKDRFPGMGISIIEILRRFLESYVPSWNIRRYARIIVYKLHQIAQYLLTTTKTYIALIQRSQSFVLVLFYQSEMACVPAVV